MVDQEYVDFDLQDDEEKKNGENHGETIKAGYFFYFQI